MKFKNINQLLLSVVIFICNWHEVQISFLANFMIISENSFVVEEEYVKRKKRRKKKKRKRNY